MEAIQKYWWVLIIAAVGFFLIFKKSAAAGSGYQIQQLSTGAGAAVDQTQQTAASLVGTLLGYDLQTKQLAAQQQLAEDQLSAQTSTAAAQASQSTYLANLQYQAQLAQYNAQANLQTQALAAARSAQNQSNWFNLFQGLTGQLLPVFANQGTFGGGYQLPGGIGNNPGGWGGWGGF